MVEKFPYGKAPFWLLAIALVSSLLRIAIAQRGGRRPDLVLVTLSGFHYDTYKKALPEFEREHGVKVELQFAYWSSLQSRLENAMLAGTAVPDMVEVLEGSLGFFTQGPRDEIGLLDLTDRLHADHLDRRLVASRLSLWSTDGRVYALPHDVHPVMFAYRRDLVEKLGIDVRQLDTWEKFVAAGQRVTRDIDGDGVIDRYMLDLPYDGSWGLVSLLLQRGGQLFDADGSVDFDNDLTANLIHWYLLQTYGPHKIAYEAGFGQSLMKAMNDGLVLFFWAPDWRSRVYEDEVPGLKGKMALMPMPAWEPGGRRTTVWGGTGLLITKQTKHPDLAWELAKYLYFEPKEIGERFKGTNIIPVLTDAWNLPELDAPNPYYSNEPLGRMYANLAPSTPPFFSSPLSDAARSKLNEAYSRSLEHYRRFGENGLMAKIHEELRRAQDYVRLLATRAYALKHAR